MISRIERSMKQLARTPQAGHFDFVLNRGSLESAFRRGLPYVVELAARLPEKIVLDTIEAELRKGGMAWVEGIEYVKHVARVLHRHWFEFHPNVRRRFVENLFFYMMVEDKDKRREMCNVLGDYPLVMVVSPTMRCNLRCKGCYSFNYSKNDNISTERLDRLYSEAEEAGIRFIVVSGGEPYLREDTLDLFAAHPTLLFMTYTNGTIIAKKHLAPKLADLGNVIPCISVEGFEKETDDRRGSGVHRLIVQAMKELKEAGVLFGFSATPMRHNNELLVSDRFIKYYMELGAKVGWYFSYMPLGRSPDLSLMPTPAQRLHRYHRIREIRSNYDIIAADFWTDGALVGGCLSGGRTYFHVNASGGVEPCVFQQFSVDNINDKSLLEVLNSPYFRDVRQTLRKVENPLRPCPIIDNPELLRGLLRKHHPTPSQPGGEDILSKDVAEGLDHYAQELKDVFDPIFEQIRDRVPWPLDPMGTMEEKKKYLEAFRRDTSHAG